MQILDNSKLTMLSMKKPDPTLTLDHNNYTMIIMKKPDPTPTLDHNNCTMISLKLNRMLQRSAPVRLRPAVPATTQHCLVVACFANHTPVQSVGLGRVQLLSVAQLTLPVHASTMASMNQQLTQRHNTHDEWRTLAWMRSVPLGVV
jgi:hypothetical protein